MFSSFFLINCLLYLSIYWDFLSHYLIVLTLRPRSSNAKIFLVSAQCLDWGLIDSNSRRIRPIKGRRAPYQNIFHTHGSSSRLLIKHEKYHTSHHNLLVVRDFVYHICSLLLLWEKKSTSQKFRMDNNNPVKYCKWDLGRIMCT